MADPWGSVSGSPTAVTSPTGIPGVVNAGFNVSSAFKANVSPEAANVSTSFGLGGSKGLLLVVGALWLVDRFL